MEMRLPHEVLVFVFRSGRAEPTVLLVHRVPAGGGYWHAIAGALEPGESEAAAARRELEEETSLVPEELRDLGHRYVYPLELESPDVQEQYPLTTAGVSVACFAVAAPPRWEPRLNPEHDEYRWCAREEALRLMHWDDAREALALAFAEIREGPA